MAVCLDYQNIYYKRHELSASWRLHALALLLLLCALGLRVAVKVQTTKVGYDLAEARHLAVQLDMERRELKLQRSILLRPDQLSERAAARLNLRPLDPAQARRISLERTGGQ